MRKSRRSPRPQVSAIRQPCERGCGKEVIVVNRDDALNDNNPLKGVCDDCKRDDERINPQSTMFSPFKKG